MLNKMCWVGGVELYMTALQHEQGMPVANFTMYANGIFDLANYWAFWIFTWCQRWIFTWMFVFLCFFSPIFSFFFSCDFTSHRHLFVMMMFGCCFDVSLISTNYMARIDCFHLLEKSYHSLLSKLNSFRILHYHAMAMAGLFTFFANKNVYQTTVCGLSKFVFDSASIQLH